MKAIIVAALLAALADGAATRHATRAPKANGKSFTLNQIENKNFKGHDAPMDLLRAHMKYAQKLPANLSEALESNPDLRIKFGMYNQGK